MTYIRSTTSYLAALLMAAIVFTSFSIVPVRAQTDTAALQAQIQQLLQMVAAIQAQIATMQDGTTTTSPEGGFANKNIAVGSRVQTTDILRVRASAGVGASWINNVAAFTGGTVIDGPRYADGYTWWHVTYDSGTSGWSVENWLIAKTNIAKTDTAKQQHQVDVIKDEETSDGTPSCTIWADKPTYEYRDKVKVSWKATGASYVVFVPDTSGKDSIWVPGDKGEATASTYLTASVLGNPTVTLKAVAGDGSGDTDICSVSFTVEQKLKGFKAVLNGDIVESVSSVTSTEADELCKVVYNDYETYDFSGGDVLECYWDGGVFKNVSEWKG